VLVRETKGAGRPFFPFEERAAIVAALECVWRVIPIGVSADRHSLLPEILASIRPDFYICRADEDVPEIAAAYQADVKEIIRLSRYGDWSSSVIAQALSRAALGDGPASIIPKRG
jgi:bifunctional ADP-heptose synthase (sugar kinase/adenylyltransferase)